MGEYLTEPKAQVWFEATDTPLDASAGVKLDRRSKMLYDDQHIFINGESFRVSGRDAVSLRQLADDRCLSAQKFKALSADAQEALRDWASEGWLSGTL
jgi:50S ribosomal protein L16 3-hydroxylase